MSSGACMSTWRSFFFSSRRRHTRSDRDWSSDVCSSDLNLFAHFDQPSRHFVGNCSACRPACDPIWPVWLDLANTVHIKFSHLFYSFQRLRTGSEPRGLQAIDRDIRVDKGSKVCHIIYETPEGMDNKKRRLRSR